MVRKYTLQQRTRVVAIYMEKINHPRRYSAVAAQYRKEFRGRVPTRRAVAYWVQKFLEHGSVQRKKYASRVVGSTLHPKGEFAYAVAGAFEANPNLSLTKAGELFGVHRLTIRRALRRLGMYPCTSAAQQELWKAKKKAFFATHPRNVTKQEETNGQDEPSMCTCVMCYGKNASEC